MTYTKSLLIAAAACLCGFLCGSAHAQTYGGDYYHYSEDDGLVTLTLNQDASGAVTGTLTLDGYPAKIVARQQGNELQGELREGDGEVYPFRAQLFAGALNMAFDDGDYVSLKQGKPDPSLVAQAEARAQAFEQEFGGQYPQTGQQTYPQNQYPQNQYPQNQYPQNQYPQNQYPQQQPQRNPQEGYPQQGYPQSGQPSYPQAGGQAQITVNGRPLSPQDLQQLARSGVQIQPGAYWYDTKCGAWGVWGMPTAGFVAAGIPAAPLPPNASNGNTGIFINGRNLAMNEALYLQQLAQGPIMPGQYWLDAQGNAGQMGGPPLINFLQAAQNARGKFEWNKPGARGWEEPNGSGGVWIANPYGGTGTTVTY